jgi:hypothetical protein
MRLPVSFFLLLILGFLVPSETLALTLRYSILIGNNNGSDDDGKQPFPRLVHAEREARRLRDRLVNLANFDPGSGRTLLLQGATKAQVMQAVRTLVARKKSDQASLGKVDSLFLFFFTGHGLSGRLLLNDGPLSAKELGKIFRDVDATFNVGIFDACYSGSLDEFMTQKGVEITPGVNIFRELPEEVLTVEGSVWFVSSGPGEVSYEDQRLGGVFTHFFIEALKKAQVDGPGITLDRIWHYVRKNTVFFTSRNNRRQVPQKFVAKLRSTGPLYFSFPVERSASLSLAKSVQGHLVLAYAEGQWVENIQKQAGQPQVVSVFPGAARLSLFEKGQAHLQEEIYFDEGATVHIGSNADLAPRPGLGESTTALWEKGLSAQVISATALTPGFSVLLGAELQGGWVNRGFLAPEQMGMLVVQLDRGPFFSELQLGYGRGQEKYGSWSYTMESAQGEWRAGWAWNLGSFRWIVGGSLALAKMWQKYDDQRSRTRWLFQPGVLLKVLYPSTSRFSFGLTLMSGWARMPGVGLQTDYFWKLRASLGLSVMARFL